MRPAMPRTAQRNPALEQTYSVRAAFVALHHAVCDTALRGVRRRTLRCHICNDARCVSRPHRVPQRCVIHACNVMRGAMHSHEWRSVASVACIAMTCAL